MADNNLDPEDIRQLTESIRDLTGTMAKSGDPAWKNMSASELSDRVKKAETDKLNADIKKLAKSINETTDVNKKKKLQDELFTKTQEKQKKATEEALVATNMLTAAQRKALAQVDADAAKDKARGEFAAKIAAMQADKTGTILKGLASAGKMINNTFLDSTKGQSKYGDVLDGAADGLSKLSILFGPFGKIVTFAGVGLLKLGAAALRHNEEMMKAYEGLAEFGQIDSKGTQQLFDNLQNAGFVMKEMDKFQGVMKGASQDLAFLGDTAAEGQKSVTQLYGKTLGTQTEKTLKNLGFTNEQSLKTYINYSTNLSKLGIMQGKTQDQVSKGSLEYAKTLDELSKLTGVQRDELQERQRQAQQDVKYRYAMMGASEAHQKQMQAMAMASAGYGEEYASGIREMMANGGQAVTEAGMKINLLTDGAASRIMSRFSKGEMTWEQAQRELAVAQDKTIKRLAPLGKISSEAVGQFGVTAQVMEQNNLWLTKSAEVEKKIKDDQAAQASGALDAQRSAETQRQVSERKAEQAKDKLNQIVGKGIAPTMERLEVVAEALGKTFARILKMLPFGPDLTDSFKSNEEKLTDKEKELKEVKARLALSHRYKNDAAEQKLQAQYDLIQQQISDLKGGPSGTGGGGTGGGVADAKTQRILDVIGKVESGGNYNTLVGGKTADLTNMSIAQVMEYQKGMTKANGFESSAVGKYQVIAKTLKSVLKEAGLTEADKFDAATQDKIAIALLKRRGLNAYNSGDISKEHFMDNIAKEWAGLPASNGKSHYAGVGSNKSGVSREEVAVSLATGGIASGPKSGYPAILHGTEMVVPIPDAASLNSVATATQQPLPQAIANAVGAGQQLDLTPFIKIMSEKFDELIKHARDSHSTQEELLQHARN